jgi:hypothetical protein
MQQPLSVPLLLLVVVTLSQSGARRPHLLLDALCDVHL